MLTKTYFGFLLKFILMKIQPVGFGCLFKTNVN